LILSPEEEQDEFDKSPAGLSRPSLSTVKATTDMPLQTARTRPQMLSDVSTTRFIRIRLEMIAQSLFEVYESIQGIFPKFVNNSNTDATVSHRAKHVQNDDNQIGDVAPNIVHDDVRRKKG